MSPLRPFDTAGPRAGDRAGDRPGALRRWLTTELVEAYGFPSAWVGERIVPISPREPLATAHGVHGVHGVAVTLPDATPFLVAAVDPGGDVREAEAALRRAMVASPAIGLGVATDGTPGGTVYLRRRFDSDACVVVGDLEVHRPPAALGAKAGAPATRPVPLTDACENLLCELHDHLRDIDGLHADGAVDELCKLLTVRLFDEAGGPSLLRGRFGTVEEYAAAVRVGYREAIASAPGPAAGGRGDDPVLRLSSPAVARVMDALAQWSLADSPADLKGRAFQQLLTPAIRSGMGQYFTPEAVVQLMVDAVSPRGTDRVLDPFCGSARFLAACAARGAGRDGALCGIEKSDRMARIARAGLGLAGAPAITIRSGDALLDFANYPDLAPASFDLVLTNPPFGSQLGGDAMTALGDFELARGRKRLPLEVLGLERCVQFLKPGGRLAIVLPDSLLGNTSLRFVRSWLAAHARLLAVVSLPLETFAPYGANIKTSVLFLRKYLPERAVPRDAPVLLLRVDDLGYDTAGRPTGRSELPRAVAELRAFLTGEGG